MSASDDLRAKARAIGDELVQGKDVSTDAGLIASAIYLSTAALIDALPDERERAEEACMASFVSVGNGKHTLNHAARLSVAAADVLLKARREGE